MKKKLYSVLYTTSLIHCKTRQVLCDLLLTKEYSQKGNLWPGAAKINLKKIENLAIIG